jgi:hypothetical protein
LAGWTSDGEPQLFAGEDLFTYIDGGAEIYFEYGFRKVIVQDYRNAAGSRLSLEIFEMESPESAYGIYTFKKSAAGEPIVLGDESQLDEYYLNLRKGPYLLTLTGLDPAAVTRQDLLLVARSVEPKLGPSAPPPGLISQLPGEGLKPQSIKYFKGPLALYNSYPFFRTDVFAFSAGAKAEYDSGYSLYIFEYPDAQSARCRYSEAGKSFARDDKYRDFSDESGIYRLKDDRDTPIFVATEEGYVMILVGLEDEARARKIFHMID